MVPPAGPVARVANFLAATRAGVVRTESNEGEAAKRVRESWPRTVGVAALACGRHWTGCDVDPKAVESTRRRLSGPSTYEAPKIIR